MSDLEHFIRACYLKTGGWLPAMPLGANLDLGDFCQIQGGEVRTLGNVLRLNGVGDGKSCLGEISFSLDGRNWRLSSGVNQSYCASEQTADEEGTLSFRTRQELQFAGRGSFLFHGCQPRCEVLTNWSDFEADITIQLTQRTFAFRHLYVVTQLVSIDDWALAIARDDNAQLRTSADMKESDYFRLFSHHSSHIEQSNNVDSFMHAEGTSAKFFKAKKLVLKQRKRDQFLDEILQARIGQTQVRQGVGDEDLAMWLNADLLNLVESNELNIATCMDFFTWADTTLDEAELLC